MQKIFIPIDNKSLFINIYNDNKSGHTPTVCTPIVQGNSVHKEVERIYSIPNQINFMEDVGINDYLNKASKSTTRVTNVFLFSKISVNGIGVNVDDNFCMFIKEEIDPEKIQFGRKKLHYPSKSEYHGKFSFNNKHVLERISHVLNEYAFVVRGFYYDFNTGILDFDVDIVGYNEIPYSKVFISNKGTGNKYIKDMHDIFDCYDIESIALKRKKGFDYVTPENYLQRLDEMKKDSIKLIEQLKLKDINYNSLMYPYSLFDFSYRDGNIKRYVILSFSATKESYFNFTIKQWNFINDFRQYLDFYMITDLYGNNNINQYSYDDILEFNQGISSIILKK